MIVTNGSNFRNVFFEKRGPCGLPGNAVNCGNRQDGVVTE